MTITVGCKSTDRLLENNTYQLYPVKYDDTWGYADNLGNLIIRSQFDEAGVFVNQIAAVRVGDLYGYISNTGDWLVKPKYKTADHFLQKYGGNQSTDGHQSKALVAKVSEGMGEYYIDTRGKPIKSSIQAYEVGGCIQINSKIDDYSIQNDDGTYEITYRYIVTTSDTSGYKVIDTTQLRIDAIGEYDRHFALLQKDSTYALYSTAVSEGIDVIKNQRALIPQDSTYTLDLQFIYEDVKFSEVNGESKPTYLLKQDGKWGIQHYGQDPILPFAYLDVQQVKYSGGYLVEFEPGKYGYLSIVRDSLDPARSVIVEHFRRKRP